MSKKLHENAQYDNGRALVNEQSLVWPNTYSDDKPGFLIRGYYRDEAFRCIDCGAEGVWTAKKQKWWYEVAKGGIFTKATRCRACRRLERMRVAETRKTHLEGVAAKKQTNANESA
jgi:hypothetical protein